jgi:hypothetical protein
MPRYFVRAPYAETVEEFADWAGKHGRVVKVHCHRSADGKLIAGSVEIEPHGSDLVPPSDLVGE